MSHYPVSAPRHPSFVLWLAALMLLALLMLAGRVAGAATFVVDRSDDAAASACTAAANDCSLRGALTAANGAAGDDTIIFADGLNDGTIIFLNGSELVIGSSLTIVGPSSGLTVNGNRRSRVFNVTSGTVKMSKLTITGGLQAGAAGADGDEYSNVGDGESVFGGGIYISAGATLTLTGCTVAGNLAIGGKGGDGTYASYDNGHGGWGGSAFGGGIFNLGTLVLAQCTMANNATGGGDGGIGASFESGYGGDAVGGGIYNQGTLSANNCTFNANSAGGGAGAAGAGSLARDGGNSRGGGLDNSGTATLTNCTVVANSAQGGWGGAGNGGSASGGGISILHDGGLHDTLLTNCTIASNQAMGGGSSTTDYEFHGDASGGGIQCVTFPAPTLLNTIVANNSALAQELHAVQSGQDVYGEVTSQGHNLIRQSDDSYGWVPSDLTGTSASPLDAGLGPLQDNGGPTQTMALLPGSPAIDQGMSSAGVTTDQRGLPRPYDNPAIANASGGDGSDIGAFEVQPLAPTLAINDVTMLEGNAGTTNMVFTVTLLSGPNANVSVHWATTNGSATAGSDYTAKSGSLTFAPVQTSKILSVPIQGDTFDEPNETFKVTLSSPINASLGKATGMGTITDDDPTPIVSINDVTVTEADTTQVAAKFTLSLSAASGRTVTVTYQTADGTATAIGDSDYVAHPSTTLTFTPGQTSKTITVQVRGDTMDEGDETFKVVLQTATFAAIPDNKSVGTILDNDLTPHVLISDVSVTEADFNQVVAKFTLGLSAASSRTVTVAYKTAKTAAGTATPGVDYVTIPSTTLTFDPGQTSKTITVQVRGDTVDEDDETFKVLLTGATNALIVNDRGTATILDNDPLPSLTLSDAPALNEGASGTHNAVFTVTLTPASGRKVTVNYATANGTAAAGSDYTAQSGTLTFVPGQTSKTLPIQVLGDMAFEPDETFKVNLSGASFATVTRSQGIHTITNDDASE